MDFIRHLQNNLNECGDPVIFSPTGKQSPEPTGYISIEIEKVSILIKNSCCTIPPPNPMCTENPKGKYNINRIRVSISLLDSYSKGFPFSDEAIKNMICSMEFLFGCL